MKQFLIIILFAFIIGCKGDPGPTGIPLSGNIAGSVVLYDDLQIEYYPDGVTVSIEGTSFSTMSLKDGSWEITGVPAGIYTIRYSKPGFFTIKNYTVQFVGGGTLYLEEQRLGLIPSVVVSKINVSSVDTLFRINVNGAISASSSKYRYILTVFSKAPIVKESDMSFDYQIGGIVYPDSVNFSTYHIILGNEKIKHGLKSGDKLYATAFVLPYFWYGYNYNPNTKKYEVTTSGVTFSNIDSVIVP